MCRWFHGKYLHSIQDFAEVGFDAKRSAGELREMSSSHGITQKWFRSRELLRYNLFASAPTPLCIGGGEFIGAWRTCSKISNLVISLSFLTLMTVMSELSNCYTCLWRHHVRLLTASHVRAHNILTTSVLLFAKLSQLLKKCQRFSKCFQHYLYLILFFPSVQVVCLVKMIFVLNSNSIL